MKRLLTLVLLTFFTTLSGWSFSATSADIATLKQKNPNSSSYHALLMRVLEDLNSAEQGTAYLDDVSTSWGTGTDATILLDTTETPDRFELNLASKVPFEINLNGGDDAAELFTLAAYNVQIDADGDIHTIKDVNAVKGIFSGAVSGTTADFSSSIQSGSGNLNLTTTAGYLAKTAFLVGTGGTSLADPADGAIVTTTVTVTGAEPGDFIVGCSCTEALNGTEGLYSFALTGTDTITILYQDSLASGNHADPDGTGTWSCIVLKN